MTTNHYILYTIITMIYTATVTQKGQVTIPVDIRKMLGVKPYQKVAFRKVANTVIVCLAPDFLSLKGSVKAKRPYSDSHADTKVLSLIKKEQ